MAQLLILALVFIGTVGLLVGAYLYVNRRSLGVRDAALARLRDEERSPLAAARSILRNESVSELPLLDRILQGRGLTGELAKRLETAGMAVTPGSFVLRIAIGAFIGLFLGRLLASSLITPIIGLLVGAVVPLVLLSMRAKKRLAKFQEQLPDAIDMMVSAMK